MPSMGECNRALFNTARLTLATLLCGIAAATFAQEERWYKVELMVFVQPSGAMSEHWPATPQLAYPDDVRFLIPRNDISDGLQPEDVIANTDLEPLSAAGQPASDGLAPLTAELSAQDDTTDWQLPTPFAVLPSAQLEFGNSTAYMQRAGGYRILFHEAWAQPVNEQAQSEAIVLDVTPTADAWPELQGSIRLFLARYLHLETNLWLNTQGEYLPPGWNMPPPPVPPTPAPAVPAPSTEQPEYLSDEPWGPEDEAFLFDVITAQGPIYPYRHAVLMQQKRRMRSNEVHYLDHPLLGVVAKLTPLDEEALHALALEEASQGP